MGADASIVPRCESTTPPTSAPQPSARGPGDPRRVALRQLEPPPGRHNASRRGPHVASELTLYGLLRTDGQLKSHGRKRPACPRPEPWEANCPSRVWSWHIPYLTTSVRGAFFNLILDIDSRRIVGWEVYAQESADHAARVFE